MDNYLVLRETNAGHLWLDDGTRAIAMHGLVNAGLAESDMRLYADGQWSVGDVVGVDIVPSTDVVDIPEVAEFREDTFRVTGSCGIAAEHYIGLDPEGG